MASNYVEDWDRPQYPYAECLNWAKCAVEDSNIRPRYLPTRRGHQAMLPQSRVDFPSADHVGQTQEYEPAVEHFQYPYTAIEKATSILLTAMKRESGDECGADYAKSADTMCGPNKVF